MPIIDRHLVFSFFLFNRSFSVQPLPRGFHQLSPLSLQEILLIFVIKRQRAPLLKAVMTSASPAARPATGEPIAPSYSSLPDQPTNRSKVCQVKTAVPLGSSSSIAADKAVKETLDGISDDGPPFEECFEFENSPNSIQSVKCRLKAHLSFVFKFNQEIPFLDVSVKRHDNNSFSTSIYRKKTFTGLYTKWDSFTPRKYKINLIRTLTYRCLRICSSSSLLQSALNDVKNLLSRNGYPRDIITYNMNDVVTRNRNKPKKILSLRYPKEMFSSFCLIWDSRVISSQSSLNLVSTSSTVVLT